MQRIALILPIAVLALLVSGCKSAARGHAGPVPDPVLDTGHRRPLPPPNRRPVARRKVAPKKPVRRVAGVPGDWYPTAGIRKDRWQCIVVHHSASPKDSPESMHRYHLSQKKWPNGLGYHFVIGNGVNYPDGAVFVGKRWKQQITGAHCKSGNGRFFGTWRQRNYFNTHGIGICLIGNFENNRPTAKQMQSLRRLIAFLTPEAKINPARVYGHGEITRKTACPGRLQVAALRRSSGGINAAAR